MVTRPDAPMFSGSGIVRTCRAGIAGEPRSFAGGIDFGGADSGLSRFGIRNALSRLRVIEALGIRCRLVLDFLVDAAHTPLELDNAAADAASYFGQTAAEDEQAQDQQNDPFAAAGKTPRQLQPG